MHRQRRKPGSREGLQIRSGQRRPAIPSKRVGAAVAWCLYDWASGAFGAVIVTFVFPAYFVRAVAPDPIQGTTWWAGTQAAAGLLIALTAAPLGAVADAGGRRRLLLSGFTLLMAACTAGLWFVRPHPAFVPLALGLSALATIAFETALVFYNALLPELAAPGRLGRLSGIAWASGYGGGLVCLALCLVLLVQPDPPLFGLARAGAENIRATAVLAAAWIALFSAPLLALTPRQGRPLPILSALRSGGAHLRAALLHAWRTPVLRRFLIARMLYADGLTALFAFGGLYAAGTFRMNTEQVLLLGIALNVSAGLGAAVFAMAEDRLGSKAVILVALGALIGFGAGALLTQDHRVFWVCALGLGCFVGPAQSASRSLMARLLPGEARNAGFGLYALSGRMTGFAGPAGIAVATALFGSQRAGMAVILILLAAGAVLLIPLRSTDATDETAPWRAFG